MTATGLLEAFAGLLLIFFAPGYATTRALFPEWRIRGTEAWRRGVEVVTLSFVLSIGWTVVIGYLLLAGLPGGFQASWSDPELELALLFVTLIAFVAGWRAGAYATSPPPAPPPESPPGEEGAWELTRTLDQNAREQRRVEHALRRAAGNDTELADLRSRLQSLREESSSLRHEREQQYAR